MRAFLEQKQRRELFVPADASDGPIRGSEMAEVGDDDSRGMS